MFKYSKIRMVFIFKAESKVIANHFNPKESNKNWKDLDSGLLLKS